MTEQLRTDAARPVCSRIAPSRTAIRSIGLGRAVGGAVHPDNRSVRTAGQRESRQRRDKKPSEHDPSCVPGVGSMVTLPASSRSQGVARKNARFLENPMTNRGELEIPLEPWQQPADAWKDR
jgi:hypothetical protein